MNVARPTDRTNAAAPDWRVGRSLFDILDGPALDQLTDAQLAEARHVTVTAISYSPKRRQYQVAMRTRAGRGETWHAPERDIRRRPA